MAICLGTKTHKTITFTKNNIGKISDYAPIRLFPGNLTPNIFCMPHFTVLVPDVKVLVLVEVQISGCVQLCPEMLLEELGTFLRKMKAPS